MFMKFEVLTGAVTVTGTVDGERGNWHVALKAGSETFEDASCERSWHSLFDELLAEACASARRHRQKLATGAAR